MGSIVVFENVSLDGVTQDPTGEEGFSARDWRAVLAQSDREKWDTLIRDDSLGAQALLLGRRSYEFFAARYPYRTGELADRLNRLPKYVVSATLANPAWNNSTVLKGDVLNEVSTLKQHIDGDIVIAGSFQLVRTLIEHDLVDELRLMVFPVVLGEGKRLFDGTTDKKRLRLTDSKTVGDGVMILIYEPVR